MDEHKLASFYNISQVSHIIKNILNKKNQSLNPEAIDILSATYRIDYDEDGKLARLEPTDSNTVNQRRATLDFFFKMIFENFNIYLNERLNTFILASTDMPFWIFENSNVISTVLSELDRHNRVHNLSHIKISK